MPNAEPQTILEPLTAAAIFLVLDRRTRSARTRSASPGRRLRLRRSVGFRVPKAALSCVAGSARRCGTVFRPPRPRSLHRFPASPAAPHAASTPGDLLFHIRAHRLDLCFELAQRLTERLAGVVAVIDEVHGFRSFDERDLLGFVDGTENPEGAAALRPPRSATRTRPSPGAATSSCRSTCTT